MIKRLRACLNVLFSNNYLLIYSDVKTTYFCSDGKLTNVMAVNLVNDYVDHQIEEQITLLAFKQIDEQVNELINLN